MVYLASNIFLYYVCTITNIYRWVLLLIEKDFMNSNSYCILQLAYSFLKTEQGQLSNGFKMMDNIFFIHKITFHIEKK